MGGGRVPAAGPGPSGMAPTDDSEFYARLLHMFTPLAGRVLQGGGGVSGGSGGVVPRGAAGAKHHVRALVEKVMVELARPKRKTAPRSMQRALFNAVGEITPRYHTVQRALLKEQPVSHGRRKVA